MPTIQFSRNMSACLHHPSISANLQVTHVIDINGMSLQPVELQGLSYKWLREVQLAVDLVIELECIVGGKHAPVDQLRNVWFVPIVLAKLKAATRGVANLYQIEKGTPGGYGDKLEVVDVVLRNRLALCSTSGSSVTPSLRLRSLKLSFSIPEGIAELAQGLHVFDEYILLAQPPLPLQACFDRLCSGLVVHLSQYYPILFGEYAHTLHKNQEYLASILNSLSSIFDRSSNHARKRQADLRRLAILDTARSQLKNQRVISGKTCADDVATITSALDAVDLRTGDLARGISQEVYCTWLKLPPPENQETAVVPALDTETILDTHEETILESYGTEDFCGSSEESRLNIPNNHSSSPISSILNMDSPPTSPYWSPTNNSSLLCIYQDELDCESQDLYLELDDV